MGEIQNQPFQVSFNASLKIDCRGSRATPDAGLVRARNPDEGFGFAELIEHHLTASRRGKNTQFPFADLLRQSVYSRLAGYEDLNDAQRLSQDPTFRLIGSEKIWDRGAALTSRLQTFETEMLAEEENLAGLARLNRALIGRAETMDSDYRTILDMDSTEIPVYGEQEQSAYNRCEDGRSAGETCALLLAFAGRRTSESEAVRQHAENDRGVAAAGRLANQDRKQTSARKPSSGEASAARQTGAGTTPKGPARLAVDTT